MKNILLLLIMTLSFGVQSQNTESYQQKALKFEEALLQKIDQDGAGLSVIITHKDQVIFENYYGYANIEKKEKLNANHVLGIASMSKQFLGMATLFLVDEGNIDLDKDIKEYLPNLAIGDRKIKIRQLLSHTSGLPELTQNDEFMNNIATKHSVKEIIDIGLKGPYRSEVGERYIYCNTGYTIATALIEQVSGMDFASYLKKKIFVPLQMSHAYSCDYNQDADNAVQRYSPDSVGYKKAQVMHFSNLIGGGAIVTNVQDMSKWCMALLSGKNLPPNYQKIWEPNMLNSGESFSYGLGMGSSTFQNRTFYYHPGMGDGMNSVDLIFPEEEISITVIRNVFPPKLSSNDVAFLAAEYLFKE